MKVTLKHSILAAAAAAGLGTATGAKAAPFVNVQVLGSASPSGPYTSTLTVTSGETVYYELVGQIASSGTINSQHSYTLSIQLAGTDGLNSIGLNLTNSDGTVTGITDALGAGWSNGTGSSAGAASGGTVTAAFAAQNAGTYVGAVAPPVVIFSGSFTAGSASTDTVASSWSTSLDAGGAKVLSTAGSKSLQLTNADEASADPYIGDAALVLTEESESVPAPGVVPALGALVSGLGMIGLVRRRRITG